MKRSFIIFILFFLSLVAVFSDPLSDYDFTYIDSIASNTPNSEAQSMDSLAAYLLPYCRNEAEKARSIYMWQQKFMTYNSGLAKAHESGAVDLYRLTEYDLNEIFRSRTGVCGDYTFIYVEIAKRMDLEAKSILGWSIQLEELQKKENIGMPTHRWNAVRIDGKWYLIDVTNGLWIQDPEEMIKGRYPDNPYWQLLENPVMVNGTIGQVLDYEAMHTLGIEVIQPQSWTVYIDNDFTSKLKAPQKMNLYGIYACTENSEEDYFVETGAWNGTTCTFTHDFSSIDRLKEYYFSVVTEKGDPVYIIKIIRTLR